MMRLEASVQRIRLGARARSAPRGAGIAGSRDRGTRRRFPLLRERTIRRGSIMNRNVTIGLGTLIVIIIVVALLF